MPASARLGDADSGAHSSSNVTEGSPNVFVNGLPKARTGDAHGVHIIPGDPPITHDAYCGQGSSTVFVNGKSAFRVGDSVDANTQTEGSPNVFIGG